MGRIKWSLVGIPDHEGVFNVGGRVGAASGPSAFRRVFRRFKDADGVQASLVLDSDAGPFSRNVASNHSAAAKLIAEAQKASSLTVVVGGGHDHGYSHLIGVSDALGGRIGCINIDAHLDVRKPSPEITSGSPFYLAIESGKLDPGRLVEFGIQRHCNGPDLWDYVRRRRVNVIGLERCRGNRGPALFRKALRALASRCNGVAVSLDLDAAGQAFAPGVSAPQADGFSASEIIELAEIAGATPKVVSLGIFELNPEHDIDDRTARLAATAAYHFIACALARSKRL